MLEDPELAEDHSQSAESWWGRRGFCRVPRPSWQSDPTKQNAEVSRGTGHNVVSLRAGMEGQPGA